MRSLGRQIVAEFYACDRTRLNDVDIIRDALLEAARRAGATIVSQAFHHFSPHGVSGAVIIAESHLMCSALPKSHYCRYTPGRSMATPRWICLPAVTRCRPRRPSPICGRRCGPGISRRWNCTVVRLI